MALRAENTRLRRELDNASGGGGTGAWFDVPRARHAWPLADDPAARPEALAPYDRRVDDEAVLEGRRGEAFLTAYDLLSPSPRIVDAVAALNATPSLLRLISPDAADVPDASIIIPVYGQLSYTLNCIHSLWSQQSRFTAEVIVVDDRSPDATGEVLPGVRGVRCHTQPVNGGFIQSCNDGAALARGRFVVLLNNDTRVLPGWLDALLDGFRLFPRAGLVGSKLLYADGSLQEAGGIIWRDGSCWNYGRNDDPNRPQYSHARQVDYVSGCSIALPMGLWRELGGFDPLFRPAYCEDADIALRVSASGREVWLQPRSRVVHYEGKTSGTDTRVGVKAYQVTNTRRLFLRWRERLERHRPNAEAPYHERERDVRRRALVVDVSAPTPRQDAGSVQTVLALQVCRGAGYKTHFVAEDNWLFQPEYTTDLMATGVECAYAPYDVGFRNFIRLYGHLFDVVLVYRMGVLERVLPEIRAHAPHACVLFHVADLHHLRREREARLAGDDEGMCEAALIKERELALVRASDCTITHSTVEAEILARETPEVPVVTWPLMFEFFGTSVPFAARRDVCFLGGYRHPPNVDAVQHFVASMLPLLRKRLPGVRFLIAGANPSPEVLDLAGGAVEVLGLVEDLRDLFDRVRVFVCPLRVGAGVKGKVLSALSYGVPVVSTAIGVEGSGLVAGEHVLVADEPKEFVRHVSDLYSDEALWTELSLAGQKLVREEVSTVMGQERLAAAVEAGHRHRLLPGDKVLPSP